MMRLKTMNCNAMDLDDMNLPKCFLHEDGAYPPKKDQQIAWEHMGKKEQQRYVALFNKLELAGSHLSSGFNGLIEEIEQLTEKYKKQN